MDAVDFVDHLDRSPAVVDSSFRVVDHLPETRLRDVRVSSENGLPLRWVGEWPQVANLPEPSAPVMVAKRAIDVIVSLLALILLAPLLLLVAFAIKATSPGPVFFRQERQGLMNKPFQALKFRSMRTDACDLSGVSQTVSDDPRITRIGRFIRRTSIDELPQLLNILWGDMSLIGPRPHVKGQLAAGIPYKQLVPYYDQRLCMRPGLSGWAQANGLRGPTVDAEFARARIDHDIAYVQNFSLWLDLKIVMTTLKREFLKLGSGD